MTGKTCAGLWVTGTGTGVDGAPRAVWQTALNPVVALELLATGAGSGTGVLSPEAFDAQLFLDLMARLEIEGGYGQAWGMEERTPVA